MGRPQAGMIFPTLGSGGKKPGWEGRPEKVYRALCCWDTPVPVTVLCYACDGPGSRWFLLVRDKAEIGTNRNRVAPGKTWRVR